MALSDTIDISGQGDEEDGQGDAAGEHGMEEPVAEAIDRLLLLLGDG